MRNHITFQTTEDGTKIEGYTADTNFTGNILEKIDKHAKEFTIPTWASELTFCMFLMDTHSKTRYQRHASYPSTSANHPFTRGQLEHTPSSLSKHNEREILPHTKTLKHSERR